MSYPKVPKNPTINPPLAVNIDPGPNTAPAAPLAAPVYKPDSKALGKVLEYWPKIAVSFHPEKSSFLKRLDMLRNFPLEHFLQIPAGSAKRPFPPLT